MKTNNVLILTAIKLKKQYENANSIYQAANRTAYQTIRCAICTNKIFFYVDNHV